MVNAKAIKKLPDQSPALSSEHIDKLEMLLQRCGCYAETIQRLSNLIVEAGGSDECAVNDREHLASSIIHLASIMRLLAIEGELILDGGAETKPSTIALFVGDQYLTPFKQEVANG